MKTLRFGLLGLGHFGRNYARLLQGIRGVQLAAVSAKTEETLSQFKSALPKAALRTTDASLILENPGIDCVVIATPPSTHFQLAKKALECGKHVLLEKPMVQSLKEAKKLRALVGKGSSTFMVGHQYVYNDYIRYLRASIKSGSLGGVKCAFGEHLGFQARQDIGCLWDAGTHQLSMLQYLFNPGRVVEATGSSVAMRGRLFDDFTTAAIKFENGLFATVVVSWAGRQKIRKLAIVGDKEVALFDDVEAAGKLRFFSSDGKSVVPEISAGEPLRNEVEHFIHCIVTGEEPLTGIGSSYQITEWLDRISRGVRKKL